MPSLTLIIAIRNNECRTRRSESINQLERAEHGAHVARRVVVHQSKHDGVHERDHVLGAVGRDTQQHVGAENVEEEHNVDEAGKVEHGRVVIL